jgi:hypothetical protein
MRKSAAALCACLAAACSQVPDVMPTSPTAVGGSVQAAGPLPAGRVLRTEVWTLELSVRDVAGVDCPPEVLGPPRRLDLRVDVRDDGSLSLYYDTESWTPDHAAAWTGWRLEDGFEGAGVAFEGLPCSGANTEPDGAPTTLTGVFSPDGLTFTAVEVRRYLGRHAGEVLYYLDWRAAKSEP